jgi:hypothetical protein
MSELLSSAENLPESDIKALESYTNPEKTIDCRDEHPNSWWLELDDHSGGRLEGKLHLAPKGLERVVIYVPGLPGDSVKRFESDFVPSLIEAGYSVFAIRHSGTRTDSQETVSMVNSELRRQQGATIGLSRFEDRASIETMINEPRVALNIFARLDQTREINLVSHSFGSLATAVSLSEYLRANPELSKIHSWVSVAGMTGRLREGDITDPDRGFALEGEVAEAVYRESLSPERYQVDDFEPVIQNIRNAYQSLQRSGESLRSVNIIAVNNPDDPQIGLVTARDLLQLARKGLLLKDKTITEEEARKKGTSVHNMPNTDPRNLVRVLQLRSSKSIREFTLRDKEKE